MPSVLFSIISGLIMGSITAYLAYRQKRDIRFWFMLGFVLGIFGILAFFFMPKQPPKEVPGPTIQGPVDKLWYYLDGAQQQKGPMSFDALSRALKEKKISLENYVWHEELPEWKLLKEFTSSP